MEKGSVLTAIEHGSVGPKRMAKAISESKAVYNQRKCLLLLRLLYIFVCNVTNIYSEMTILKIFSIPMYAHLQNSCTLID